MTTDEMIEIMKASQEGKRIEIKSKLSENDAWTDITFPNWNWVEYDYRIKPENKTPTYRPYKSIEEMYEDIKKRLDENYGGMQHPVFSGMWLKQKDYYDIAAQITGVVNMTNQEILLGQGWIKLNTAFNDWVYLDGTPFGIEE